MKHLKQAVVILMTTLMCITNFTTVFADDEQATAEPESLHSAHYEFVLKDSDEELPEEIMALLPEEKTNLKNGTVVTVEKIEDVSVYGENYNFLGWDKAEDVIQDSDITFVGTWGKDIVKIEPLQNSVDTSSNNTETPVEEQKETYEGETYKVDFSFIRLGSFTNDGLPEEVKALLPESQDVPEGKEPELPNFEITSGYQFKGWDKAEWTNDEGELHTLYVGIWDKLKFMVIPGGYPGPAGAVKVTTGGPVGVPGSAVPSFTINGQTAYCVTPNITGYPVSGTSYYPAGMYGDASGLSERAANVMITGKKKGASDATIQAAVWDALGSNHGVSWRDYYDDGIEAWGEVYETYHDPNNGKPMQDIGYATGYRVLGGYVKVYKRSAEVNGINYASSFPNNYSLAGAVYGIYADAGCSNLKTTVTTGSSGESNQSSVLDEGTYYVKEITASPGFTLDLNVYPVTVTAGNTSSITSTEKPISDPMAVRLFKKDRRESKWVEHLDEAQFTVKYYDAKTKDPRSLTPKLTFIFKCKYNNDGDVYSIFGNPEYYAGGDNITPYIIDGRINFPLGTFTIEETLAPQLFAADPNIYVGHITQNGEIASESVDHFIDDKGNVNELTDGSSWILDIDNVDLSQNEELQTINLVIQKINAESGRNDLPTDHITNTATLAGGVFHIYRIAEYNTDKDNPQLVNIPEVDYGTITTDETGKAELKYERVNGVDTTDGLLPGKFKIVEEKAPNGFALNKTVFTLDAPIKERNTANFQYSIDISDKLTRIQVEKLDQNGDLISGEATATIQLIENSTGRVVYEFVADGQSHLIKGLTTLVNYHLHEIYVAPNYKLAIDKEVNPIDEDDSELHGSNDAEHSYTNYYHMVDHEVEIHTTATFDNKGKKEWDNQSNKHYVADGVAHIYDEVAYKNVYEGENYKLVGELWDKTDNVSLNNVVEKEFTPAYDVGIETLEFDQQLDDLDNHELVVFETLYRIVTNDDGSKEEIKVVEHKDLDDEGQTIYVDELYRADFEVVKYNADDEEEMLEGVTFNVHSYRVKRDGVVEDIDLGEFTTDADGLITIEQLKEDSKLTVTEVEEKDPTWYRWEEPFYFDIGHNDTIELHTLEIENHQIKIGTSAKFKESNDKNYVADGVAHIIDTVNYEWLYKADEYKLVATLIDKGTEEQPLEEEVTRVEHEFTAEGLKGTEDVIIEFNLDGYDNHDFVVFEELYRIIDKEDGSKEEVKVAEHKDIEDDDQTVHVDELYRAAMVLYKIGNGNKDIKLNGAYFNVATKRTKRDGTLVEKDLGTYVTGGILIERDAAFRATVYSDEALTTSIRSVESSYDSNLKKQAVTLLSLPEGEYWVKVEGEEATKKYEVSKGTIVLFDQPEDTEVTFTELVAPAGYYIDRKPFIVNVGHDHELERVENYRSNSLIIITNRIPDTGYDG